MNTKAILALTVVGVLAIGGALAYALQDNTGGEKIEETLLPPQEMVIGIGATGTLYAGYESAATIGLLELVEDSRCPTDVQCIWAGTVRVRASVNTYNRDFTFTLGEPQGINGYQITLMAVSPEKHSTVDIKPSDYRFTFTALPI